MGMKPGIWICCLLCLGIFLPQASAEPMSIHVIDGDVRTVLSSAARLGGMNLILDDSVQGQLTLQLESVEPADALRLIAQAKGLSIAQTGDTMIITGRGAQETGFYTMHVFPVRYADLKILYEAANLSCGEEGFVSKTQNIREDRLTMDGSKALNTEEGLRKNGRLMVDRTTNSLLLYGTDAEAARVQGLLDVLDVPVQQVSLEAKVVAIQKDASKKLGIEWEWSKLPQSPSAETSYESVRRIVQNSDGTYGAVSEDVPKTTIDRSGLNGEGSSGVVRFGRGPEGYPYEWYYAARLQALITEGKANVLARPNITTLQGREAVINIGGEVPVPTVSTTNATTTTSVVYRPAGIILRYTPRVNEDGFITAEVHTEVSSPLYVEELKVYRFQKRSADTMVRLRDGETMVIGGLIGSEECRSVSKIPFLGDLPILGAFFRSVRNTKTDSEIMIFLTAHVLKDSE